MSVALNYSQGDASGLAGDFTGIAFGLIPGGRLGRQYGGAAFDAGRNRAGQFLSNWRGRQGAQDIATEGMQERLVGAAVTTAGCAQ